MCRAKSKQLTGCTNVQVIELREKRLDMEDVLQDVQTISNDIKRNLDRLVVVRMVAYVFLFFMVCQVL